MSHDKDHKHKDHDHHHGSTPPRNRPIHHSPMFWVAVILMLAAMVWYVASGDLAFGPGGKGEPVPAAAP